MVAPRSKKDARKTSRAPHCNFRGCTKRKILPANSPSISVPPSSSPAHHHRPSPTSPLPSPFPDLGNQIPATPTTSPPVPTSPAPVPPAVCFPMSPSPPHHHPSPALFRSMSVVSALRNQIPAMPTTSPPVPTSPAPVPAVGEILLETKTVTCNNADVSLACPASETVSTSLDPNPDSDPATEEVITKNLRRLGEQLERIAEDLKVKIETNVLGGALTENNNNNNTASEVSLSLSLRCHHDHWEIMWMTLWDLPHPQVNETSNFSRSLPTVTDLPHGQANEISTASPPLPMNLPSEAVEKRWKFRSLAHMAGPLPLEAIEKSWKFRSLADVVGPTMSST